MILPSYYDSLAIKTSPQHLKTHLWFRLQPPGTGFSKTCQEMFTLMSFLYSVATDDGQAKALHQRDILSSVGSEHPYHA